MLKSVQSFIANLHNVVRIATTTITLCLILLTGLPMLPAIAGNIHPMASIGVNHQAEGALKQGIGKAEQVTGDLKGKAKGLSKQADGKAKRDIGRVESAAEKLTHKGQENATHLGEKLKDGATNLVDSVRNSAK
jgi:uncharacterized protein YjbJ (UPF0337 family)